MPKSRARFVALVDLLARRRPDIDPSVIPTGRVLIDGRSVSNPATRVRSDAALRVVPEKRLRGDVKLSHVLDTVGIPIAGRVAVDVGASAGGFTAALLARGARRVYAVDAGVGQLRGWLRADPRVVNLEGHNLGVLDSSVVPDAAEVITVDLSYLALADAVPQFERLEIATDADLVALVKPTFELRRSRLASSPEDLVAAVERAVAAIGARPWMVVAVCNVPTRGQRGAREAFVHAAREARG